MNYKPTHTLTYTSPSFPSMPVITQMNAYYGQCLYVCKCLHDWHRRKQNNCLIGGATSAEAVSSSSSSSTTTRSLGMEDIVSEIVNCTAVDRLLYAHVMEMCQTAAADELLCGMSSEVTILSLYSTL